LQLRIIAYSILYLLQSEEFSVRDFASALLEAIVLAEPIVEPKLLELIESTIVN